jgi:hypothetical protein
MIRAEQSAEADLRKIAANNNQTLRRDTNMTPVQE